MSPAVPPPAPSPRTGLPGLPPPERAPTRWVIYVDLDAFYVACEVRERPELAGRPVIVGPPPSEGPTRGVVLSASYEARRFGVHSAQPAGQADRRCPEAIWVRPDFAKYERASQEVRALLRRHSEELLPFSIDEAALRMDAGSAAEAREIATTIQREIAEELHLPASLGVATSRLVAKIATDRAKPGGIVVVPPEETATFVAPLPLRAVPGVGPKTEELLRKHGFERIGELAAARPSEISRWLGGFGRDLVALARGSPIEDTDTDAGPRSRSTDRTLPQDAARWEEIEPTVRSLAESLAGSLAEEGLRYAAVGVALRWQDFSRTQRVRSLAAAREGPGPMVELALRLAHELWESEAATAGRSVRTVSVRAERLSERTQRQGTLDDFEPSGPATGGAHK